MNRIRSALVPLLVAAVAAAAVASPSSASPRAKSDTVGSAVAAGDFTTLTKLLKSAGLVATALEKGTYTVFAPTNAAFAKLPKSTLAAVGKDPALLKKVLTYHVVKGKAPAAKVVMLDGKSVKTLEGQAVKVAVRGGKVYLNGSATVTKTDVMASNGIIHVINRVLIPKG